MNEQMSENAQVFRRAADLVDSDPQGRVTPENAGDSGGREPTHAVFAAKHLYDAADFFGQLAGQNPSLKEQMNENAAVYRRVASLVESDRFGELKEDEG